MLKCIIWCAVSSKAQNEPDKISLPQQEADARALAEGNGWQILDVLKVPGHSRRYIGLRLMRQIKESMRLIDSNSTGKRKILTS